MSFTVIIPARYGSTRLEGKALLPIAGKPMVQHVYQQALKSDAAEVLVATDDQRIADAVQGFNGNVVMTKSSHASGTDRLQEVAEARVYAESHIVVNVQGDEPMIPPQAINQVATNLAAHPQASVATLCEPIEDSATLFDTNAVKVVRDQYDRALYFSRAPIPWQRQWTSINDATGNSLSSQAGAWFRHVGIYAYRVGVLNDFVQWPVSALEKTESLEQLRAMDNGAVIHCAQSVVSMPGGVDTAEDLDKVRRILEGK